MLATACLKDATPTLSAFFQTSNRFSEDNRRRIGSQVSQSLASPSKETFGIVLWLARFRSMALWPKL